MEHYIDIRLKPDAEMRENVLMNKLYSKLHKALCNLNSDCIGVSFPEAKLMLGRKIRLHSHAAMLNDLQGTNWLGGLSGYCEVTDILSIPKQCIYQTVSRIQSTMSQSKLNRLIKRGSITEREVKAYKAKMFSKGLDNPYLELESGSNGQKYRRYILLGDMQTTPVEGKFDTFGLSEVATVPVF